MTRQLTREKYKCDNGLASLRQGLYIHGHLCQSQRRSDWCLPVNRWSAPVCLWNPESWCTILASQIWLQGVWMSQRPLVPHGADRVTTNATRNSTAATWPTSQPAGRRLVLTPGLSQASSACQVTTRMPQPYARLQRDWHRGSNDEHPMTPAGYYQRQQSPRHPDHTFTIKETIKTTEMTQVGTIVRCVEKGITQLSNVGPEIF